MNIKQAAEQVKGTISAYLSKDVHGLYRIPFRHQRPIFMQGPPGVGKTAVIEQVADELGINFVSYSITHHTRQSALGLPFIAEEEFEGRPYKVSEYTMSEIIAAVYHARKESGLAEGVLFLDEVNCVSETLAPAMLQFLQYKTFGTHRLPEGWIIVCAGNPPEYNRAAREFDPVMLDRMIVLDVQPDLAVWQEYAVVHGVHPAVTTYLDAKHADFYNVRAAARGSKVVTPRGWEDLSRMIQAYEAEGMTVPGFLPSLYLQDAKIASDFGIYYELFRKYEEEYRVVDILTGEVAPSVVERAANAQFDERIALIGLLLEAMLERVRAVVASEEALRLVRKDLLDLKEALNRASEPASVMSKRIEAVTSAPDVSKSARRRVSDKGVLRAERLRVLGDVRETLMRSFAQGSDAKAFDVAKQPFNAECEMLAKTVKATVESLDKSFEFLDTTFGEDSQESLIYVTKLSANPALIRFVSGHGSQQFLRHNKSLLLTERNLDLINEVKAIEEEKSEL